MFPKQSRYAVISEYFALNLIISVSLKNKYSLYCNASSSKTLNFFLVKLIEYNFSVVSVCSNPCVGHLPRIKMSFFLLSICGDEPYSKNYHFSTNFITK